MKIFNRLTSTFIGLLRFLAVLAILAVLVFIIQWRIDHLFAMTSSEKPTSTTITEEIDSSKKQLEHLKETQTKEETAPTVLVNIDNTDPKAVAQVLKESGFIQDPETFIQRSLREGHGKYFTKGTFDIPKGATNDEVFALLTKSGLEAAKRTVQIEIPSPTTPEEVANIVYKEGLIQNEKVFVQMLQEQNAMEKIQAGGYNIQAPIKAQELIDQLTKYFKEETAQ